MVSNRYRRYE